MGCVTSWAAADRLMSILDDWAVVTRNKVQAGVGKTMIFAVRADHTGRFHLQSRYSTEGVPQPYVMRDGQVIDFFDDDTAYPHVGHYICTHNQQGLMLNKMKRLLHGWVARVRRARGLSPQEHAEWLDLGFNAFAEAYGEVLPVTYTAGEALEAIRRAEHRRRSAWTRGSPNADFYLRSSRQGGGKRPQRYAARSLGNLDNTPGAVGVGVGWTHFAAVAGGALHARFTMELAQPMELSSRDVAHSRLALTMYSCTDGGAQCNPRDGIIVT